MLDIFRSVEYNLCIFDVRRKKDVCDFCYDNDVHVHVYDAHFLSCIKSHGNFLLYLQRKAERFSAFLMYKRLLRRYAHD